MAARILEENLFFGRSCPVLTLSGGSRGGYLQLPDGILNNKNGFSISFYCKLTSLDNYGTICSFGVDHCFYLSVLPDSEDASGFLLSFGATKGGRSQETALEHWNHMPFDTWFHTVLTMDTSQPSRITLYLDGKKAGEASHRRMTALDLNDCQDCFFGFGSMSQNPLSLTLGEIRIFRECLSEDDVCSLFSISDDARTELDAEALFTSFPTSVSADLSLPEYGEFHSTIRWISETPWLVTDSGKVRRPGSRTGRCQSQHAGGDFLRQRLAPLPLFLSRGGRTRTGSAAPGRCGFRGDSLRTVPGFPSPSSCMRKERLCLPLAQQPQRRFLPGQQKLSSSGRPPGFRGADIGSQS